jgi:ATP-dependent protease Clp ATPase subunit
VLDVMYDLPEFEGPTTVTVTRENIQDRTPLAIVAAKSSKSEGAA